MNYRFNVLDSFRGLCAICVVLYHLNLPGSFSELDFFNSSSLFVSFFFVLSGFVLAHSYINKDITFKFFFWGRVFRIFPLHLSMLILMLIFQCAKLIVEYNGFHFSEGAFSGDNKISEIIPNILLLQSWLPFFSSHSFNAPSWSISVEFYIYILFFITLVIFLPPQKRAGLWCIIGLLSFLGLFYEPSSFFIRIFSGLGCFFSGAFMYLLFKKQKMKKHSFVFATFVELLLLIVIYFVISSSFEFRNIVASFLFMCVVFYFAHESGYVSSILKRSLFLNLGALSYSIYLTHMVILNYYGAIIKLSSKLFNVNWAYRTSNVNYIDFGSANLNNLYLLFVLLSVVLCSVYTHKYIEVYWQRYFKNKFIQKANYA